MPEQYEPPPHTSQTWTQSKPAAHGRRGVVVSQARAAAEAGVAILDAGGNAIDAAVGTALALAVVEPWNSGLGGIGHALVHRVDAARADWVDFGPVAPGALDPARFRLTGEVTHDLFTWPAVEGEANVHGPLSIAVPSSVAGYGLMHDRWGRMPWREVAAPAVALARRGLPQDWFATLKIASAAAILRRYAESSRIYLRDGLPPAPPYGGPLDFLPVGRLPDTLARLADAGWRDFYMGEIAGSIAADVRAAEGALSAADLRGCEARVDAPTVYDWLDRSLQLPGKLTAAPTLMRVLDAMRDARQAPVPDAAWFATLARTLKAAYAERLSGLGESEPAAAESCTTHLTVCDAEGNAVSMTTTLLTSMGSRMVLPGTGILMNNGVMWFDPRPGRPNSIAPGKRPLTNMLPLILAEGGRPWIAAGASGGRRILASVMQMVSFAVQFGMHPAAAAHHPRIDVSGPDTVTADRRLPPEVIEALRADGPVDVVEHVVLPGNFASPNMLMLHADGARTGISDAASPWSAAIAQHE